MVSSSAAAGTPDPDAVEFVRFCYRRRRVGWPELYDEMCAVAGRGLFRGYDADDLAGLGIGFSLFDMPALSILAARVIADEQARRRPVTVTIAPEVPTAEMAPAAGPDVSGAGTQPDSATGDHGERSFEVPIRLALVPSGA